MVVDSMGDVIVTNDGVTILEEMNIEHPAAKMIVEIAKTQEDEVGDGTTTAVVLAGELLKNAENLLEQKIHPTVIAKGYRMAAEKANVVLNNMAEKLDEDDNKTLKKIAITAMTGKGAENNKELLADITVKAIKSILEKDSNNNLKIDEENIKLEKKTGGSIEDSQFIKGILLDKEKVHNSMPNNLRNPKIALINSPIEIKSTETDAKIQINDPTQMQAFLEQEEKMLRNMVEKIINSGANVVFCQKGIDDLAQHFLAKQGIYACRRVKRSDMLALARATGANIITNLDDLRKDDLGKAGNVEERKIADEQMTYVEECKNHKSVTLLIRGSTEHVIDEVKRAMEDAVGDIISALEDGKIVAGAGAPEIELARNLKKYAESLAGREQLAVLAFAESMEVIPKTLAENSGLDPINVLTELKAAHDQGRKWAGINVFTGKVIDAWKVNIIEPLRIKTQAVSSAAEVAVMILRIDDVIATGARQEQMPPQGMPPMM